MLSRGGDLNKISEPNQNTRPALLQLTDVCVYFTIFWFELSRLPDLFLVITYKYGIHAATPNSVELAWEWSVSGWPPTMITAQHQKPRFAADGHDSAEWDVAASFQTVTLHDSNAGENGFNRWHSFRHHLEMRRCNKSRRYSPNFWKISRHWWW